ncbi:Cupin 2, conserved barrel [Rubrobacter xylanophilus DSM 9941]|uniref:Cupin 2, conserved barrel n=1 Tax=Rubrobacter xylanophilus (strain DSM 9941 / JCM 11954 / NBRC 16129 / PRD-1) TaxID=266117 RepID=Q1ASU2_RUBXD|nr:cupin domain-containing protein [Rubrobacter xylanophilus]ABG05536.1 Cupin 2, conserved barrel [Rubrobacter xylanophilus DSM 9941]
MEEAVFLDLARAAAEAGDRRGAVWTLAGSGELNANLLRFPAGGGVEEHVNEAVDVLLVGVSGEGAVRVGAEEHRLRPGTLVVVPKGARRSLRGLSADFSCLSVHRRRGPLLPGRRAPGPG